MSPHDFLDEQWTQDNPEDTPGRRPRHSPSPQTPRRRRRGGQLLVLVLAIVVMLAAAYFTLRNPREVEQPRVEVATPSAAAPSEQDASAPATEDESSAPAVATPPPGDASVEAIVTRWATRENPKDTSWSEELADQIAPDTARRMPLLTCLPAEAAPLRVDGIRPEGEPARSGTSWSGDLTVTVTDKNNAQTPLTVRAQATWDEGTARWTLTGLECLASGGGE